MGKKKNKPQKKQVSAEPTSKGFEVSPGRKFILGALCLLILVLVTYSPSLDNHFIWDDPEYLINNPTLRTFQGLTDIWLTPKASPQYYPLVFTTFWMEFQLWELEPFGYHLVNLLLHALAAGLLWILLKRLDLPGAWIAAAVFAVHPVHVESVTWITERKNLLSLVFYLGAGLAYLRFSLSGSKKNSTHFYWLSLGLFLCALWSKTVTCTLPAAILLILWWKKPKLEKKDMLCLIPFFVLGIFMGLMTAGMEKYHVGALGDEWSLSPLARCLLAGRIPWFYISKLLWPQDLIFIYPRWEISTGEFVQYLYPLFLLAAIAVLFFYRKKLGKGPLTGFLFFVGTLFPALGFFNVFPMRFSYVADHFQYHASLGFICLCTAAIYIWLKRIKKDLAVCAFAILICVLGGLSYKQQSMYANQEVLWTQTLKKNPKAWIAHNNLGDIMVKKGNMDAAVQHCKAALKLKADLPEALGNLANALYYKNEIDDAIKYYRQLLELQPDNIKAKSNFAAILHKKGLRQEAYKYFYEVLEKEPSYQNAHFNLANLLMDDKKIDEALKHYKKTVGLNPNFHQAHWRLGRILSDQGKYEEAAPHLKAALERYKALGNSEMVRTVSELLKVCEKNR